MTGHTGNKITALYCRLSRDDGNTAQESSSIQSQKEILQRYARENGFSNTEFYVDDGYSGTDFNRPSFQRMISDVKDGKVSAILSKDLSRLGRNYLETGLYLEIFFPEHGVRYIAVNDSVDTAETESVDFTPFRNIINEWYAKDTSKKIRTARRARVLDGNFIGTSAPYGYMKDPEDNHRLVIDERYAPTVRLIFSLAKSGMGISKIRDHMNTLHILRPAAVSTNSYSRYFDGEDDPNRYRWNNNSVRSILRNPVYAGHLVMDKRVSPSFKSKKRKSVRPENYKVVRNVHEPIIDPDEFDTIQRMITSRRHDPSDGRLPNIFAGLIKCADCGKAMTQNRAHRCAAAKGWELVDQYGYMCNNYRTYGNARCTMHWIEARDIREAVLEDIRKHAREALSDSGGMKDRLLRQLGADREKQDKAVKKELREKRNRLSEVDRLFAKLYEDRADGQISDRNYQMMRRKYEEEQAALQSRIDEIQASAVEADEKEDRVEKFSRLIREYAGIDGLDAALLNRLIEKVTVGEPKTVDGETVQEVQIYYKFIGNIQ